MIFNAKLNVCLQMKVLPFVSSTWMSRERVKLTKQNSMRCADAMPIPHRYLFVKVCHPFWFLLHFLNTNRYFATSDEVINVLRRFIPNFSKQQSFLSKEQWVATLLSDDRLARAVTNAMSIGKDGESYSNLYKLFTLLKIGTKNEETSNLYFYD